MHHAPDWSLGEITQSLLALIVVLGGGVMITFVPEAREAVVGLMGLVIGFYFNRANGYGKTPRPPESSL